ncbi:efflux RND transporter periplasmic adaptor subunit [candidate division KSB1 bacterium]|nr:efflux RND transporter periplasmic adaptor subunit [candidate division KSB1 bacterium]
MKKTIITILISVALGLTAGWFFFRPTQETGATAERKILYYVDPMHPEYKSDKPGTAPDCGMDLVPVYEDGQGSAGDGSAIPGAIKITPEKQQLIGVQTGLVAYQEAQKSIRAVGQVAYAEPKLAYVTTKFEGYIESLLVDYTGKLVEKGQPLFTIYSPELVSTQEEYLLALKTQKAMAQTASAEAAAGANTLLESAKRRLQLWDISEKQIEELERSGEITKTLTIYSPIRGYVLEKMAVQGLKVMPGMNLYQIADLSTVWVLADIYEYEIPFVKIGQEAAVTLTYYPGEVFKGRVTYIYPFLAPETRTVKVRLEFSNPGEKLKPGMYANVNLQSGAGRQLAVPEEAVMDAGAEQIVFVAHEGGYFEPRQVKLGAKMDDRFIVLSGLTEGEKVVTSGNFLIDSESRLKSAASGMAGMGHGAHGGEAPKQTSEQPKSEQPDHSGHAMPKSETSSEHSGHDMGEVKQVDGKKYTCSMHPEVVMDAPGRCPKCGMNLVEKQ